MSHYPYTQLHVSSSEKYTDQLQDTAFRQRSVVNEAETTELLDSIQVEKSFANGETLFREGDDIEYYYFIRKGELKGYKLLSNGREQITRFMIAGEFLLFPTMDCYSYSCELLSNSDIVLYPKYEFDRLIDQHDALKNMAFRIVTEELASSQRQILLLGRMAATERVSKFLIDLLDKMVPDFQHQTANIEIKLPMTRADIADYLGLTIETVSRVFSKLRSEGIIMLPKPNQVQFCDSLKLRL